MHRVPLLEVEDVRRAYGKVVALDGLSLSVAEGDVVGLLGPNGAGKTTLIEVVCGLRGFDSGSVTAFGRPVRERDRSVWRDMSIALPASTLPPRATAAEVVDLYRHIYGDWRPVRSLLESVGLAEVASRFVSRLSNGQRQRLALLLALMSRPKLLLLDEPTSELDPHGRQAVWDLIRDRYMRDGGTVLLATHQMDEAMSLCSRVGIIVDGRLAAIDTPDRLIETHCPVYTIIVRTECTDIPDIPGAEIVRSAAGEIHLRTENLWQSIAALADHMHASGGVIQDITVIRPSLEDVFFAVAGRALP